MWLFKDFVAFLAAGVLFLEVAKWSHIQVCAFSRPRVIREIAVLERAPDNFDPPFLSTDNLPPGEGTCIKIVRREVSEYVPYMETYRERTWLFYRIKLRTNYRLEFHTKTFVQRVCCDGYVKLALKCKPHCERPCEMAICVAPNKCKCYPGYQEIKDINNTKCQPVCTHECNNGVCIRPEICQCNTGYWMSSDGITCLPVCDKECEANYGYCTAPHVCTCHSGYRKVHGKAKSCEPDCEVECVNGYCVAPNVCKCKDGYEADKFDANFTCTPRCSRGCIAGTCTAPETCTCNRGYKPVNGSVCEPICSEPCKMGVCVAPESCSCNDGYGLGSDSKYTCKPICRFECNNGTCTAPGVCTCDEGFFYDNSTEPVCKPSCETPCGPNSECTSPGTCTCLDGYRSIPWNTSDISDNSTEKVRSVCRPVCDFECVHGDCTAPNVCTCDDGYRKSWLESSEDHLTENTSRICEPVCYPPCGPDGYCDAPDACAYRETPTSYTTVPYDNSTSCAENCVCNDSGVECNPAYSRNCSGHGDDCRGIGDEYSCKCNFLWKEDDCEKPVVCVITTNLNQSDTSRITIINDTNSETTQTLADAPDCYQCDSYLSNTSLCYTVHSDNSSAASPIIGCLPSTDLPCHTMLRYNASFKSAKILWPVLSVAVLIVIGMIAAVYLIYRRHGRDRLNTGNSTTHLVRNSIAESLICENSISM